MTGKLLPGGLVLLQIQKCSYKIKIRNNNHIGASECMSLT